MKRTLLTKMMFLLCALIAGSSSVWADGTLVSALNDITSGDTYYITAFNNSKYYTVPNTTISGQTFTCTEGTLSESILTPASGAGEFIFTAVPNVTNAYYIYNTNLAKYLVATGSKTFGYVESSSADYGYWTFTTVGSGGFSGSFSVKHDDKTHYIRAYNNSVRCYDGASNQGIYLFKKSAAAPTKVSQPSITGTEFFLTSTKATITCGTDGATIQYSTNSGESWNNYSDPFTLNETTTVIAKATKSGLADSEQASKTFTKVTPMTVAAALTAIAGLGTDEKIANQGVSGKISQIDSYSSNAITYWISDDGTTASQLEVFKGKGLNGANFTAISDLNVGDEVVVFGDLTNYQGTTPEFASGSQLLSYSATGVPAPVITASNVTIDTDANSGEISYEITNPTGESLVATVKTGNWISNVQVDAVNNKVTFSVTANDGEQRVGYITLSYTGAADKDVKITQKASYGVAPVPFAFAGGKSDIEGTAGLTHNGLGSDYGSDPKLKFDNTDDYLILKIGEAAQKLYFDIKGNSFSGGTFTVQTSADGVAYTDLKAYTELGDISHEALDLASSVRFIKWIYTAKDGGNVAIGRIGVDCAPFVASAAGYTTFCTANKIDFANTAGVTAYKVSAVGATSVTLEEIAEAPENTPVVVVAAEGNHCLKVAESAAEVTGNLLLVSNGNVTTNDDYYVYALAKLDDVVGFYLMETGVKVPAGKCYLSVRKSSPSPEFLGFDFDNLTNIANINAVFSNEGVVYDLQGRKVAKPAKGLYIVNGRKVIIK